MNGTVYQGSYRDVSYFVAFAGTTQETNTPVRLEPGRPRADLLSRSTRSCRATPRTWVDNELPKAVCSESRLPMLLVLEVSMIHAFRSFEVVSNSS